MNRVVFYLAGRWDARDRLRGIRDRLLAMDPRLRCASTWLEADPNRDPVTAAMTDLNEVYESDVFFLDTLDPLLSGEGGSGGGREVEFGAARALQLSCYVIGPRRNIFHHPSEERAIFHYPTWEAFFTEMQAKLKSEVARG